MTPTEFETWMSSLSDTEYDALIKERVARLNDEQRLVANAREVKKKERYELIVKMKDSPDEEAHERLLDAFRDTDDLNCEHGRSYCKHCTACGEMDGLMFPELFNKDGFRIGEDDE